MNRTSDLLLLVAWIAAGAACEPALVPPDDRAVPGTLATPQAVAFADGMLLVTNTHYTAPEWGPGDLTVLDPESGALVNRIPTTQKNPQRVVVYDDVVYVVNSGVFDLSDFDTPRVATPGGIDRVPVAELATAEAFAGNREIAPLAEDPRVGGPVDIDFARGRGVVALGITSGVLLYDPATHRLERDTASPIWYGADAVEKGLGTVVAADDRFYLADFNSDRLFIFDAETGRPWRCYVPLGESADLMEGAQSMTVDDGKLYVVMTLSGVVRRIDPTTIRPPVSASDVTEWAPCPAGRVETVVAPLGQMPNDIAARDGVLYVLHSGDNNVVAYDGQSGEEIRRWVFGRGSNPWNLAISEDGVWMAVTEYGAHAVTVIDLRGSGPEHMRQLGGIIEPVAAEAAGPPAVPSAPADVVVTAPGHTGEAPFDAELAVNGVRGGGRQGGGADVFSLGNEPGPEGDESLVVRWSDRRVTNGPGPDFVVFENGFRLGAGEATFMDLVIVELSRDGETWVTLAHDYVHADETEYSNLPAHWVGFAGRQPVLLHEESHPVDPFDAELAGGDAFDLADLPDSDLEARAIKQHGFTFIRLVSAAARTNPDTGNPFVADPISNGADIDGVYGRYLEPEATR